MITPAENTDNDKVLYHWYLHVYSLKICIRIGFIPHHIKI